MSVDTSKIRAGDTGTINVRFRELGTDGASWWVAADRSAKMIGPPYYQIAASAIATHTPAPWTPSKWDVVAWKPTGSTEWQIVVTENGFAWIRRLGHLWGSNQAVAPIDDLTFVRAGGEPKPRLDAYPKCSRRLAANLQPFPRTCVECGLGPCKVDSPPEDQA